MKDSLDIRIAFFDIDGTILNSNKVITKKTIDTLNKLTKKGIEVVICSGRGNSYVTKLLENIDSVKYSISSDGALVYNHQSNIPLFSNKVSFETILEYYRYAENNNLQIILNTEKVRYVNRIINNNTDIDLINDIEEFRNINVYSFILVGRDYNEMFMLEKKLNESNDVYIVHASNDFLNKVQTGDHWFDIVNSDINKGNAIDFLIKKLNIDRDASICFGDSINDIDMFSACGIKIAMGNALDVLKDKADYITDTNDNDGIYSFFKKYLKTDEK